MGLGEHHTGSRFLLFVCLRGLEAQLQRAVWYLLTGGLKGLNGWNMETIMRGLTL